MIFFFFLCAPFAVPNLKFEWLMASQIVYPYHVALLAIISLLVIGAPSLVSFTRGS